MAHDETLVIGVDIGSIRRPGGFAWADASGDAHGTDDPSELAAYMGAALRNGRRVALAIESPLSVPIPSVSGDGWHDLGRARTGEGNRSWSAGAGSGSLATGLAQLTWLLSHVAATASRAVAATVLLERFRDGDADLLITEAMVTGEGKPEPVDDLGNHRGQDLADAVAAARRLEEILRRPSAADEFTVVCAPAESFNLAAAAALRAQLDIAVSELAAEVVIARVLPVGPPS
ncbi:hypothetical protein ACFQS2_01515 [Brachybacterium sp. GCM10030267]|uniref:hypothetical protein n=1 Tax=Brachybacterium sp. GCM10030267 TaxID=3273381 RepID=UPI00361200C9